MYRKAYIGILILNLFFNSFILAQEVIVDSTYSIPDLDGEITMAPDGFPILPIYINSNTASCGDMAAPVIEAATEANTGFRSFFSFELPSIPEGYEVDSVYVRFWASFYINDMYPGDTLTFVLSHIEYGDTLDFIDFFKGDVGNPFTLNSNVGTITVSSGIRVEYIFFDLTECVINDYENNRNYCQLRFSWLDKVTDWDHRTDRMIIYTSDNYNQEWFPKLKFYFKPITEQSS